MSNNEIQSELPDFVAAICGALPDGIDHQFVRALEQLNTIMAMEITEEEQAHMARVITPLLEQIVGDGRVGVEDFLALFEWLSMPVEYKDETWAFKEYEKKVPDEIGGLPADYVFMKIQKISDAFVKR
jgi:hypothetical protein